VLKRMHDGAPRDEAFELIRSLIDEICLMPDDGHLRVESRGELSGILALAADSKTPGGLSATGLAQQIKMVAGTGNQRYLQALRARIPILQRPPTAGAGI
jgi:hypothetical protein